ncbi:MAG: HAD family hydrolase [Gammaproteobacteria bacterium]|nr:HAD family hydrolase [Gammaproteobacteria bacterium]MCH9743637.1 HAD family hydrolase [Gammaproteobacteria bacterium]
MLIVFDLDGTLIDTPEGIVRTFLAVFKNRGRTDIKPEAIRQTIGRPLEEAFASLLDVSSSDPEVAAAVKEYRKIFDDIVLPNAKELVFPDVVQGLNELKEAGARLAVATHRHSASTEALLKATGIFDHFEKVVCANQVTHKKPHPEMGNVIMQALGVTAEECIMVGDTTYDILMGKNAGMSCTIAVTYGVDTVDTLKTAEPDYMAGDFNDVMSHLQRFTKRAIASP